MTSATFYPTPETSNSWLDDAQRAQLVNDLANLPTLAEILERNYFALLCRGDRDPSDSAVRYVTRFDVLDLADRRPKWEHTATRTEPLTLADRGAAGPSVDPAFWADLARRMGARRQGILPTVGSWVSLAVGEMHDAGEWHLAPADPDRVVWVVDALGSIEATKPGPTIASECSWLATHLEWIVEQQWSTEFADEIRRIVRDLAALGITTEPPARSCLTAEEIADAYPVSRATVYRWWNEGRLTDVGKVDRKRVFVLHEIKALLDAPPNR